MKCPTDGATLVMSERSGIEIDYCPDCRGIWLDRGELDKIIERVAADAPAPAASVQAAPVQAAPVPQQGYREPERYRDRGSYDPRYDGKPYRKKKKESWLMELFD